MSHAIRFDKVTVRLDGRAILDRFSLDVADGEKVVLAGPSGSGKSTVLRALLGFVLPDTGRIEVVGQSLGSDTVWGARCSIAYVPQEPQLGFGTARQWLADVFSYRANAGRSVDAPRVAELLQRFSLPLETLDKQATSLSGGETQRVAIVAALLLDRPILLLDEPTSALDKENRRTVYRFLAETRDKTMLVVSHEDPALLAFADRVVELGPPPIRAS